MYYPAGHNRSLMIILLVAYIIQVDRCSADDPPPPAADPSPPAAETTTEATDSAAIDPNASSDDKLSTFNQCKTLVGKTLTDIRAGTGMMLRTLGHATLAVMSALFGTYNGAVWTTAVTGETVASGLNLVNNVTGRVALVGDVTSGIANLATEAATTFRKNAENNIENRKLMVKELESRLDNFHPESEAFLVSPVANKVDEEVKTEVVTAATTDNVAAAAA
ncbi:uncharacterized protein LOC126552027 isoform X1 [Aphis gossypii]|nr:uncharacterized protein LOC126552027 isoform X1 [Aphis gossypii]